MAEQVLIQFRADKVLKQEVRNAFYELRKLAADVPEMSLDEINAEILAARAERNFVPSDCGTVSISLSSMKKLLE